MFKPKSKRIKITQTHIGTWVDKSYATELDKLARENNLSRSTLIKQMLDYAKKELK